MDEACSSLDTGTLNPLVAGASWHNVRVCFFWWAREKHGSPVGCGCFFLILSKRVIIPELKDHLPPCAVSVDVACFPPFLSLVTHRQRPRAVLFAHLVMRVLVPLLWPLSAFVVPLL